MVWFVVVCGGLWCGLWCFVVVCGVLWCFVVFSATLSLPYIYQVLYVLCFSRPRYQVSVYRTIGPLVVDVYVELHIEI